MRKHKAISYSIFNHHHSGFTLIEISITLIIIGLIIGGLLIGRDLIAAANLRRFVSNIEQYNTAINTFKNKYNCLPGDCAKATQFFGTTDVNGYLVTNGNGDDKINEKCGRTINHPDCWDAKDTNYETGNAFQELALAGLIAGKYDPAGTAPGVQFPSMDSGGAITGNAPGQIGLIVYHGNGTHWWETGIVDSSLPAYHAYNCDWNAPTAYSYCSSMGSFTPTQAASISSKIADGTPSGIIQPITGETGGYATYWINGINNFLNMQNWNCWATCANMATNQWCINPGGMKPTDKICNLAIKTPF